MAQVIDRWHKTDPSGSDPACQQHSTKSTRLVAASGHGVGSRWQVRYRDPNGKQRAENFASKPKAEKRAAALTVELDMRTWVSPEERDITFREAAEKWRAAQPHRFRSAATVESRLRVHAYPAFGRRLIGSIRTSELQTWGVGLVKDRGLHPSTARSIFKTVRAVFNAAVRDGIMPRNPCHGVKLVPVPHTEVQPLSAQQVKALAAAVPAQYRALIILAVGSGLRIGELFGLEWRHVDLTNGKVVVEQQLQKGRVCPPKTDHSYRTVPVSATVVKALKLHKTDYPGDPDDTLFAKGPVFAKVLWPEAVKKAGLPKRTGMHTLRHTYASVLIAHQAGPKTVAARLGDTVEVAMATYAHLFPDEDQGTREAVEDFLGECP
ncbi:tyrosine-type recombinase/integrase [Streptomyces sp. NPDC101227]|uniref:tyrosine-type recombinase/integrase n=1 Tax=Streptomyces sp. NPDC101227 TaxID=3366136 RepID=UPI00381EB9E5